MGIKWFKEGIEDLAENLLKNYPITRRILVPSETILDLPNSVWEDTLEELNYLNNQFVNTEVILLEKSEEKTQKERQVKIETEEHENIVDNKKAHIEKQVEIKEIKVESRGNSEETHREEQVKIETEDKNIGNNKKS